MLFNKLEPIPKRSRASSSFADLSVIIMTSRPDIFNIIQTLTIPAEPLASINTCMLIQQKQDPTVCKHIFCDRPLSTVEDGYGWCGRCIAEALALTGVLRGVVEGYGDDDGGGGGGGGFGGSFCKLWNCEGFNRGRGCRRCYVWGLVLLGDIQEQMDHAQMMGHFELV